MCNTDSVRRDAFCRNSLILLRNFGLSSTAVNLFNLHVSEVLKKGPTNKHYHKQDGMTNAS